MVIKLWREVIEKYFFFAKSYTFCMICFERKLMKLPHSQCYRTHGLLTILLGLGLQFQIVIIFAMANMIMQGDRYSLSQQVINFEMTVSQLRTMMSADNLNQYLSRSLTLMVFGSNDYLNNYLMPSIYPSSYNYNPSDFANLLLNRYARQIVVFNSHAFYLF